MTSVVYFILMIDARSHCSECLFIGSLCLQQPVMTGIDYHINDGQLSVVICSHTTYYIFYYCCYCYYTAFFLIVIRLIIMNTGETDIGKIYL